MPSRAEIQLKIKILIAKVAHLAPYKDKLEKSLQFIRTEKQYNERKILELEDGLKPQSLNKYGKLKHPIYFRPTRMNKELRDIESPEFQFDKGTVNIPRAEHILEQQEIQLHLDSARILAGYYAGLEKLYAKELKPINELYELSLKDIKQAKIELVELDYPSKSENGQVILRKPARGELTKKCKEIAERLGLTKFETMKDGQPEAVLNELVNVYRIDANLDTVKSTLRRADYCKAQK